MQKIIRSSVSFESRFPNAAPYVWMLLSATSISFSSLFVKKLSKEGIGAAETLAIRSNQLALFSYALMVSQKIQFYYKSITINRLLIARGVFGTAGIGLSYYGLGFMPLSDASVLMQIYPVFTGIIAVFVLGDKFEKSQLFSALFCILGVILIMQPAFIFGQKDPNAVESSNKLVGTIMLLLAGLSTACVEVLIKKVGAKTNAAVTTLVFGMIGMMVGTVLSLFQGWKALQFHQWLWMLWLGVLGFLSQVLKNRGFMIGNAGRLSNMNYFGIIVSYGLDTYVLGNDVEPLSILGGFCIISCMFVYFIRIYFNEKNAIKV